MDSQAQGLIKCPQSSQHFTCCEGPSIFCCNHDKEPSRMNGSRFAVSTVVFLSGGFRSELASVGAFIIKIGSWAPV